nr:zinc finger BED domain-containing protein RICESLEEPER 2-like [Ipomoea batatas]
MGMNKLLDLNITNLPRRLGLWLVQNFDPRNCTLQLQNGQSVHITTTDVAATLGLPMGQIEITRRTARAVLEILKEWRAIFEKTTFITPGAMTTKMLETEADDPWFKRHFVLLVISTSTGYSSVPLNPHTLNSVVGESNETINEVNEQAEGVERVECIHCHHRFAFNKTGTTTSYKRHQDKCAMRKKNVQVVDNQTKLNFLPSDGVSSSIPPLHHGRVDMEVVRESIANWIIMHEHLFTLVEEAGFNVLIKRIMLEWKRISRSTIKSDCLKVYEIEKKKLKNNLESVSKEARENISKVKEIINTLYEEYVAESMNKGNSETPGSSNTFGSQTTHPTSTYHWDDFDAYCEEVETAEPIRSELEDCGRIVVVVGRWRRLYCGGSGGGCRLGGWAAIEALGCGIGPWRRLDAGLRWRRLGCDGHPVKAARLSSGGGGWAVVRRAVEAPPSVVRE